MTFKNYNLLYVKLMIYNKMYIFFKIIFEFYQNVLKIK